MKSLVRWIPVTVVAVLAARAVAQDESGYNNPYYPLQVGHRWTYKAETPTATSTVVVEVLKKETLARTVTAKDGKQTKEKVAGFTLKISSGDKTQFEQVAILPDGVYRFQAAGKAIDPPLRFFKLPLTNGDRWTVETASDGAPQKGTFKAAEANVEVPAGRYPAMAVTCADFEAGMRPMELAYWFAPKVGMVKQSVKIGPLSSTLELVKFEPAK